jgi:hypothetical protein
MMDSAFLHRQQDREQGRHGHSLRQARGRHETGCHLIEARPAMRQWRISAPELTQNE